VQTHVPEPRHALQTLDEIFRHNLRIAQQGKTIGVRVGNAL
jgi:hypothetical protein